ncbi:hypothetical protein [Flavobacterium terrisoli]|uniref:hypothetical protein n=1 Tax=Flavobacterium terrisoli TaxID=3242195 RepID=UPI002543DACA|nr:hypothetical protein [Flavobacterium buctense]
MENKKDIGKAISDKLSSLDKTPRENVWSGISYELQKKKKRRFAFFFFWTKAIGLLLIGAIAAWYVYDQNGGFDSALPNNSKESIIVNGNDGYTNTEKSGDGNTNTTNAAEGNTETDGHKLGADNNTVADSENAIDNKNSNRTKNNAGKESNNTKYNSVNGKNKKTNAKAGKSNNSKSNYSKATKNTQGTKNKGKLSKAKANQLAKAGTKKSAKNGQKQSKAETDLSSLKETKTTTDNTTLFDPTSLQNNASADKTAEINSKKTDSLVASKKENKKKTLKPEEKKEKDSTKTDPGFTKFYVDTFVSPTHYGYFSNFSTLDKDLNANATSTDIEMNYGFGLSYQLTEKVLIRIGYSRIKLNYTTKDAIIDTANYSGIKYKPGINNQSILAASNGAETMDITQNITYTEIPLEMRYRFLDKKFGMHAIVGFSFVIRNDDTVTIKTDNGYTQNIGRTKGLLETSVSTNIGFGVDYKIFNKTTFFLEPTLNYQAISFEKSDYKPYYFGLHIGFRYALIDK